MSRELPPGGGIILTLCVMVPFWLSVGACSWTPRQMVYPDGLVIIRGDQALLDSVCSHYDDKGVPMGDRHAAGCYDRAHDTIYLLNNCVGAEALPHELGHREGLADPEAAGLNW